MIDCYPDPGRGREPDRGAFLPNPGEASGQVGKAWMITFSDLISLMLTFFVMLFAMSNVKLDEWTEITDALNRSIEPKPIENPEPASSTYNISTIVFGQGSSLEYLAGVLQETLSQDPDLARSLMVEHEDRLVVTMPNDLLFDAGSADLEESAREVVASLGSVLRNLDNRIVLDSHTGSDAPLDSRYASNWELSIARSLAVADVMRQSGVRQRIDAIGYADSQFDILSEQDISDDRLRALTDRVDIVVYPARAVAEP